MEFSNEKIGNGISDVTIEDVVAFCNAHGKLLVACDSIMSNTHAKKGQVAEELLNEVDLDLELFRKAWLKAGMHMAQGSHLLLTHLVLN